MWSGQVCPRNDPHSHKQSEHENHTSQSIQIDPGGFEHVCDQRTYTAFRSPSAVSQVWRVCCEATGEFYSLRNVCFKEPVKYTNTVSWHLGYTNG